MTKPVDFEQTGRLIMTPDTIRDLYTHLYGDLDGPNRIANFNRLAQHLSRLVSRDKPWTGHYLYNLVKGYKGFTITEDLERALQIMTGRLDGQSPLQVGLVERTVYSRENNDITGAVVLGKIQICPECQGKFVASSTGQVYCTERCSMDARNRRKREGRKEKRG